MHNTADLVLHRAQDDTERREADSAAGRVSSNRMDLARHRRQE